MNSNALTTANMNKKVGRMNGNYVLVAASTLALVVVGALTIRLAAGSMALAAREERVIRAETDRWTGLAEHYAGLAAARERALAADTARWTGLAEHYAEQEAKRARVIEAETARWTGLAAWYAERSAANNAAQTAYAAHYTGLALAAYEATGDRSLLPSCISADVAAQLPTIGDDGWRTEVEACGE